MTINHVVFLLVCASTLSAQVSAVLSGTVTDQSGAVVSAANVTAKNIDTGAIRSTVTDASGRYQISSLPVGQYEIHAGKTGFTEEVRTGVHLVVGQSATVDLNLQVGESSQQVDVNGDAPLVGRHHRGHIRPGRANSRSRICRSTGAATTSCSR